MGNGKWFRFGGQSAKSGAPRRGKGKRKSWLSSAANRCALSFESLEDRRMLANYMVSTTADIVNGAAAFGSLRWALNQANASDESDVIVFSQSILSTGTGSTTISLNGGALTISDDVRILGPGARKLSISQGTGNSRVFNLAIDADTDIGNVEISGVTITSGGVSGTDENGKGGGVFNRENLLMKEVIISGNSAANGGGGVYTAFGSLTLERSLVLDNTGGGEGGGGILNGRPMGDNQPSTTITNTTVTDNFAGRWGGGVFNRNGSLLISSSTITDNTSGSMLGGGVASYGNPLGPDPPAAPPAPHPDPTVFTRVRGSIIWGNNTTNMGTDFDRVGMTTDTPARELAPSVVSLGFNIVGTGNTTDPAAPPPTPPPTDPPTDYAFKEPGDLRNVDPDFRKDAMGDTIGLEDAGGSTDVFLLEPTSPAIDKMRLAPGQFDQRGRHFTRRSNDPLVPALPPIPDLDVVDIGAVEMQAGEWVVDTLRDESDSVYNRIHNFFFEGAEPVVEVLSYEGPGDLSLREALEFAFKNPGPDTITFAPNLNDPLTLVFDDKDKTPSTAPTILLTLGALFVTSDVDIQGPEGFILEVDAVGSDVNPQAQDGTGTRVFNINGPGTLDVKISNLTIMGADFIGQGGGLFNRENLTLSRMTFKGNNATDDGGALFATGGSTVTIDRSTFSNNRAGDDGAAIFVTGGADVTVTSSTISGNVAGDRGGGIVVSDVTLGAHVLVEHSTLTLNEAGSFGSGISVTGASATAEVFSSIVAGNIVSGSVSSDVHFESGATLASFTSQGYNLVGRGTARTAFNKPSDFNNVLDPMLEPLSNTGGLVETHAPIYRPTQGLISPVIDRGQLVTPPTTPEFDQRGQGFLRAFDVEGVEVAGLRVDIGAYELQGSVFTVTNLDDENDGVISGLDNFSLREAIELANLNPLPDVIRFDPLLLAEFSPTIAMGSGFLKPGTPADIRITSSMIIEWQSGDSLASGDPLTINGFGLDNPSDTIFGSRMFRVDDGNATNHIDVEFRSDGLGAGGIVFTGARAPEGGGVFYSRENLTFRDATFINNVTIDPNELIEVDQTGLHGGVLYQDGVGSTAGNRPKLSIFNGLFTGNLTIDVNADGGAMYVVDAELAITDSTVAGNSTTLANSDGGAIALKNSKFTSTFSTITGNVTQSGAADGGGVHFVDGSDVTLIDTVVSGNSTAGSNSEGGGLAGVNSTLAVIRSIVSENATTGTQSSGGGLAMTGGAATFDASSIRANTIGGNNAYGGGVWNNGGVLTVRGSSIVENEANHATGKGGGVYSDTNLLAGAGAQSTTIVNSTVSGNSAGLRGGGVFNADGRTDVAHSTVTNNSTTAAAAGGGIGSFGNVATTVTSVHNSILSGNVGTDVSFVDGVSGNSFLSLGYNIVGAGNGMAKFNQAGDLTGVLNAGLSPLDDHGAPAGVVFEMLTHALLPGSIAINSGNPAAIEGSAGVPLTDQRGVSRVRQGRIDIGAYEFPAGVVDFDGDGDADGADFLTWQRNLGKTGNATIADGDADGDKDVDGQDLALWKDDFGGTSAGASAGAAAAGRRMLVSDEAESAGDGDSSASIFAADYTSLASLGVPGSSFQSAAKSEVSRSEDSAADGGEGESAAAVAWDSAGGYSLLDDESDQESLLEEGDESNGAAEDAVFAAWGEQLSF